MVVLFAARRPGDPAYLQEYRFTFSLGAAASRQLLYAALERAVEDLVRVLPRSRHAPTPGIARDTILHVRRPPENPYQRDWEKVDYEARRQSNHLDAPYDDPPMRLRGDENSERESYRNELALSEYYGEDLIEAAEDFVDTRFHNRLQPLSDLSQHTLTNLLPPTTENAFEEDEASPFDCIDTTIDDDMPW